MTAIILTPDQYAELMEISDRLSRETVLEDLQAIDEQADRLVGALEGIEVDCEPDDDVPFGPTERELASIGRRAMISGYDSRRGG
jgi:hypothetical protein